MAVVVEFYRCVDADSHGEGFGGALGVGRGYLDRLLRLEVVAQGGEGKRFVAGQAERLPSGARFEFEQLRPLP